MPASIDNIRYFSIIMDSVTQAESITMRGLIDDILILPQFEIALDWYKKHHPKILIGPRGPYHAYQWMLEGFEKEARAKVADPDSDPNRISIYLVELESFFNNHQKLIDKYSDTLDKLVSASFNADESDLAYIEYRQAALEGAKKVLYKGPEIINYCHEKLSISKPANKKSKLIKTTSIKDIWLGDEDSFWNIIKTHANDYIAQVDGKTNWTTANGGISYLAGFTFVCIQRGWIAKASHSAPTFQKAYQAAFDIEFNDKPFKQGNLFAIDEKYCLPFKGIKHKNI